MLSGVGQLFVVTQNLDNPTTLLKENIFFPGLFVDFNFEVSTDTKKAKAWVDGRRKTVSSAPGDEEYTLKLAFEYLDWFHLAFAYDELPQTSTNVKLPTMKSATVPTAAPYEILDADITAANASSVKVYVSSRGTWGEAGPRLVGTTPIAAKKFIADGAAGKLTFHASDAGAPIQYVFTKTYASAQSIGHELIADSFGKLSFLGQGYGPEFPQPVRIYLPSVSRSSTPSLQTDDVPKFEIEFEVNVPPGSRTPYRIYNLAA